jgi:hypothetical protein
MRKTTIGLLLALTLVLASPAAAEEPIFTLPNFELFELILGWFSEAEPAPAFERAPALELGGFIEPQAEASPEASGGDPQPQIGIVIEAGG